MQALSRNQEKSLSCGISLHHSEILSVHDANGNCLSGCTRCKRCMANVLRKVFKWAIKKMLHGINLRKPKIELYEGPNHYPARYHGRSKLPTNMTMIGFVVEH